MKYTRVEQLEMSLRDAEYLINRLVSWIDWETIPGTTARSVAMLRNSINKTLRGEK